MDVNKAAVAQFYVVHYKTEDVFHYGNLRDVFIIIVFVHLILKSTLVNYVN